MSWKMFWQIVLLMVIGALILSSFKVGLMSMERRRWSKHFPVQPPQKGMQQRSMQK